MVSIRDRIAGAMQTVFGTPYTGAMPQVGNPDSATARDLYAMLRLYYASNRLYDDLREAAFLSGLRLEDIQGLRNPTYRLVEFYVAKIWGGPLRQALPLAEMPKPEIEPVIHRVWAWSNWAAQKQTAIRSYATTGDLFLKVVRTDDIQPAARQVYFQRIEPEYVTAFDTDHRRYLTHIRIDTPQARRQSDGTLRPYTHTEVWDKQTASLRIWEHEQPAGTALDHLGTPTTETPFAEFGVDFIPIVWAPFRDVGGARGMAAVMPVLDKVDEANRSATRLHQMLFKNNRATWVVSSNSVDANGRPIPAPLIRPGEQAGNAATELTAGDEVIYRLPGMSTMQALVPPLNYADALSVLNAQLDELAEDLPELAYYKLPDMGRDASGRALQIMLAPATDRVVEVRGNADAALVRANQMALTLGQVGQIPGFEATEIGTWESGAFEHAIGDRPVVALSDLEESQAEQAKAQAALLFGQAGWPQRELWRMAGYDNDEIDALERERATQADSMGGALLDALNGRERP